MLLIVGAAEPVPRSSTSTQSACPTLLLPVGVKKRVPLLAYPEPMSVYAALVGSNHRARTGPLIAPMSTVMEPLCAGGMYATSNVPSVVAAAAT